MHFPALGEQSLQLISSVLLTWASPAHIPIYSSSFPSTVSGSSCGGPPSFCAQHLTPSLLWGFKASPNVTSKVCLISGFQSNSRVLQAHQAASILQMGKQSTAKFPCENGYRVSTMKTSPSAMGIKNFQVGFETLLCTNE